MAEDYPEPQPEYLDSEEKIQWPECVSFTDLMRDERVQAVVRELVKKEMKSKVKRRRNGAVRCGRGWESCGSLGFSDCVAS